MTFAFRHARTAPIGSPVAVKKGVRIIDRIMSFPSDLCCKMLIRQCERQYTVDNTSYILYTFWLCNVYLRFIEGVVLC